MADFDPYYRWLGIRDPARPPNHYRLLGLELFEDNPRVVQSAADRQMAHLRTLQTGQHSRLSQQLLNEVASAKICLLNPAAKSRYDTQLRGQLGLADPAAQAPVPGLKTPDAFQTAPAAAAIADPVAGPPRFDALPAQNPDARDMGEDARQRAWTPWWVRGLVAAWSLALLGAIVVIQTWYGGPAEPEPPRERKIIVRKRAPEPPPPPPKKGLAPTGEEPPAEAKKSDDPAAKSGAKLPAPAEGELVELRKLPGFTTSVWGVAQAGREQLVAASIDRALRVTHIETGVNSAEATAEELVYAVATSVIGDRAVFGTADGGAWFWNYTAKELPSRIAKHEGACRAVAISPDGKILAAGGEDGVVLVHRLPEGERMHRWEAHSGAAQALAFAGEQLLITGGNDGWLRWWNVENGEQSKAQQAHPNGVTALVASLAGKRIVSADRTGAVSVWNLAAERQRNWSAHQGEIKALALSANGRLLATGGQDTLVKVWDLETGEELAQGARHKGPVLGLTFSPAGDWLASCGADSTVRVWQTPGR